jgi:hypothetical protein
MQFGRQAASQSTLLTISCAHDGTVRMVERTPIRRHPNGAPHASPFPIRRPGPDAKLPAARRVRPLAECFSRERDEREHERQGLPPPVRNARAVCRAACDPVIGPQRTGPRTAMPRQPGPGILQRRWRGNAGTERHAQGGVAGLVPTVESRAAGPCWRVWLPGWRGLVRGVSWRGRKARLRCRLGRTIGE